MVPPQNLAKYLYELRAIAENIVTDRCETSEVHPPTPSQHEADVHPCEVEATNVTNVRNTSNLSQVTLDWKDLVSPSPCTTFNAAENLAKELDMIGKCQAAELPVVVAVDTFTKVSQIAEEAVIDVTQ